MGYEFGTTWAKSEYDKVQKQLDNFIQKLSEKGIERINGITISSRESQNKFMQQVLTAIKEKKILLMEAKVGTGKSFGYLIPIFYAYNGVDSFNKVIISTSSIALQEQLLEDIEKVSVLLGINIKAYINKGMNNYVCLKRLERLSNQANFHKDNETVSKLKEIKSAMYKKRTADKSRLPYVNESTWNSIQVCGNCSGCSYFTTCDYLQDYMMAKNAQILITNHTHLANGLFSKDKNISESDLIVIDEAHKLEETFRLFDEKEINFDDYTKLLDALEYNLQENGKASYEVVAIQNNKSLIIKSLKELAYEIRMSILKYYRQKNNDNIQDYDKLTIDFNNKYIMEKIKIARQNLRKLLDELVINPKIKTTKSVQQLIRLHNILYDMEKMSYSKNVYWAKFVDEKKIKIGYCKKDLSSYFNELYRVEKPIVFTSGTLDSNPNYDYLKKAVYLDEEHTSKRVECVPSLSSPFNYKKNSIFYYASDAVSPRNYNKNEYLLDIAIRIKDLITITEGKTLVLFTSKSDMKVVYDYVKKLGVNYKLILQQDRETEKCKLEFSSDVNSCLFATGSFWEGIDIKGKSLSNLIIVKLPFPVQDPVVTYKKEGLDDAEKKDLDISIMLNRLAQGTGRLIRSTGDTGIVTCLDSRFEKYSDYIMKVLPFTKYTDDLNKLPYFAKSRGIAEHQHIIKQKNSSK